MPNRINGWGVSPADSGATRRTEAARSQGAAEKAQGAAAGRGAAGSAGSADKVDLTPSAVLLQRLEEQLRSVPEVDAERVRAIKDAIAAGEYRVDAERVADKLVRLERELR